MATLNLNKKKFIDEENLKTIVKIGINFGEKLNALEAETITDYDETKTYLKGESCYHDNYIYRCKSTATGAWNPDRWEKVCDSIDELTLDEIKAMLGLTTEQLTTLSSIILDSEVRLDKTYSSSKIYTSIQDAIDTAKAYTLAEIGKASGASYKIASSTSDMTDEKIIYLLQNGSTYDMYIVDGGTPTRIGDVSIDLSDYYTKTEINNDFLKKTDAISTYATKTEIGDKVDKTSIKTVISNTPSDNNLLSEKYISENIVKKSDVSTTINNTSTDDTVPTTKLVWDSLCKICDTQVLVDANKPTSKICMSDLTTLNTPSKEGKTTAQSSLIISIEGRDYWNGQISIHMASPEVFVRSVRDANTWTKWRKLCSTSVEDVPVTNVDLTGNSNVSNGDITYMVRNGICYVSILNVKFGGTAVTSAIPEGTFPKPIMGQWQALSGVTDCTKNILVSVNSRGGLSYHLNSDSNMTYDGSFSYPVAES